MLLILDDLHWADAPSLALLRFVSRELEGAGPLVVGIYRHAEVDRGHPLVATLADLTHGQDRRRVLPRGLDQQDVASFVALVAGVAPSPGLAAALYQRTDGNPFFVTEVVRLLASQGRLDSVAGDAEMLGGGLPEGVRAVGEARVLLDEFTAHGTPGQVREQLERWDSAADLTLIGLPPGMAWDAVEATLRAAAP